MKSANMQLFSRVLAAIFGGYALTSGVAVLLSAVLPLSRAEAVLTATLSAFVVYTCAVIWVFAVQDLRRAWLGMLLRRFHHFVYLDGVHAAPRDSSMPMPPQAMAGSSMPSQARRRSCTAKTQMTAQV